MSTSALIEAHLNNGDIIRFSPYEFLKGVNDTQVSEGLISACKIVFSELNRHLAVYVYHHEVTDNQTSDGYTTTDIYADSYIELLDEQELKAVSAIYYSGELVAMRYADTLIATYPARRIYESAIAKDDAPLYLMIARVIDYLYETRQATDTRQVSQMLNIAPKAVREIMHTARKSTKQSASTYEHDERYEHE